MQKILLLIGLLAPVFCWAAVPATAQPQSATQPVRDSSWAEPIKLDGVPNLNRVTPNLYRSAQPTRAGMARLKELGIKTVVNLRAFHSDEDELKGTGLKGFSITMNAWHAETEDAIAFLKIVNDPANQPVLVHCLHGADRTGTMCALYRMTVQGWTKQQAVRELTDGGYGFHGIWANLKKWLDKVDIAELRREAGLTAPSVPTTRP